VTASPRAGAASPARWALRGALLLALAFANLNAISSPDVVPNALLTWTLLREGDVDYDEFVRAPGDPEAAYPLDREAYFFRACGRSTATEPPRAARSPGGPAAPGPADRVCSIFPPGMGLLALPLFLPFVIAGVPPHDFAVILRVGHLAAAAVETVAALLLWSIVRRFVDPRWSVALVLLYVLGTSVRTVSAQALWQHAGVHLGVAFALWLVLHQRVLPLWRDAAAGGVLGLAAIVRQTSALAALGLGGTDARRVLAATAAAAAGALPLLAYNALAYGDPLEQGYGAKPFDTPVLLGLYGLLLSPSRGLLVYAPYLIFALAALVLAWRRPGEVARRLRGFSVVWLAVLLLYATYAEWWGGRVFGPRFLDDLAPLLFAALAWGIGQGLLARSLPRLAFWIAAAWSLVLFQAAAFAYDPNGWDTTPLNVNFHPERLLDWSDPQWLAVLRSLPAHAPRAAAAAVLSALVVAVLLRLEGVLRWRNEPVIASRR
jgi:hypothetical protein